VSLSAAEQRALTRIADELAASDTKLASMLGVFNRISSDEKMPERQCTGGNEQREAGHSHRTLGRARNRRLQRRTVKPVWSVLTACILLSTVLITVVIALSHAGHGPDGRLRCPQSWLVTCTQP
jgi:Protein of unknown function (DUF3040)